jgi:hypothetical protein
MARPHVPQATGAAALLIAAGPMFGIVNQVGVGLGARDPGGFPGLALHPGLVDQA